MDNELSPYEALQLAVQRAGGQTATARFCGVSQNTVWKWLQSSKRLPAEHVLVVERETGVPRWMLRPDIYPRDLPPAPEGLGEEGSDCSCNRSDILQRGVGQ